MPKNVDSLKACVSTYLKGFTDYDRTVDIVSGFEAYFNNYNYEGHFIYFDRFPKISSPNKLTPDFMALFDNYGLIFEITKGIAKEKDDKPLVKKLRQLMKYDSNLEFKSDDGNNKIIPENQNIVLILNGEDSNEAFKRINQKIGESNEFKFKNKIVFLEYNFIPENCCYSIKKYAGNNGNFQDEFLPEEIQLEKNMESLGKSLKFYPKHFMLSKAKNNLCNDRPTDLYMSVYLWNKVLYNYLTPDQILLYQKGSSRVKQNIDLNIDILTNDINEKYIKNGNVRITWVKDAMVFLEKAKLAQFTSKKDVRIHYHNLQNRLPLKGYSSSEAASEHDSLYELAKQIAYRHCNGIARTGKKNKRQNIDNTLPKIRRPYKQMSLFDLI